MTSTPIHFAGDLAAFASPRRVHFTPPLHDVDENDPRRRFVYAMALYARDIAAGALDGPYEDRAAELYARTLLVDDSEFAQHLAASDLELAARFGVPVEQIALKRADLASA